MKRLFSIVLLSAMTAAQNMPASNAPTATEKHPVQARSSHPDEADAPVITIKGMCSAPVKTPVDAAHKATGRNCQTVVTRTEFERLVNTLQVPPQSRKQFAGQYAKALILGHEAQVKGLDRGPHYEDLMKLAKLQVLTRQLAENVQRTSAKVSEKDINDYYGQNQATYQEANLLRLYIPRTQQHEPPKEKQSDADVKKQEENSEATMKKAADDLRSRAAKGEDFAKLQEEAYKLASFKASPPNVKMEKVRKSSLPPAQAGVFDMKPGDVSQVFPDSSGYFVYKLESEDAVPMATVHDEIQSAIQKQRIQQASETIQKSATPVFNESYFASVAASPQAPPKPNANHPAAGPK